MTPLKLIHPDWTIPANIRAFSTTRQGGSSLSPWASLNLATHVGDTPQCVDENRARLCQAADLPSSIQWLNQTHGTTVHALRSYSPQPVTADAIWTDQPEQVCAVLTADCLPILMAREDGKCVSAIHAGWRGLAEGIIEKSLQAIGALSCPEQWHAWIGPAISVRAFEVGQDVYDIFCQNHPHLHPFFHPPQNCQRLNSPSSQCSNPSSKWMADLPAIATELFRQKQITRVWHSNLCTWEDNDQFFSYRREGTTGRIASLIWIAPSR
jgi:YfiH family protein